MDEQDQPIETWTVKVDADTRSLQQELNVASGLGRRFSNSLIKAFQGVAIKGKSLGDVFRGLALDLSNMVLKAAFKPLEQSLGNAFSGLFSGGFGFANGGVLAQGTPTPFAKGGVIAAPTLFPMATGTGLMGERGAEAIMPLSRGADGRLGVAASGGAGGGSIVINIATPDVESFRQSESQVAALVGRALSAGQRNT
ncbi:MAG: phage tail tape measure protein [Pseudomonadota bacterium]